MKTKNNTLSWVILFVLIFLLCFFGLKFAGDIYPYALIKPYPTSTWKEMFSMIPFLLLVSLIATIILSGFPNKDEQDKKNKHP
jgi:hypothetical protein